MDKMSYDEAVAQLGAIVSRMEDPNVGITEVKDLIKKANELIAFCKNECIIKAKKWRDNYYGNNFGYGRLRLYRFAHRFRIT